MRIDRPFSTIELRSLLEQRTQDLYKEIDSLDGTKFAANSHEYLAAFFTENYRMQPLVIGEEDPSKREMKECKIKKHLQDPFDRRICGKDHVIVDGIRIRFFYSFEGSPDSFKCQASTYSLSGYPPIDVEDGFLVLTREYQISDNAELPSNDEVVSHFSKMLSNIASGAQYVTKDIDEFNRDLPSRIETRLSRRENQVRKFSNLFDTLNIPLTKHEDTAGKISMQKRHLKLNSTTSEYDDNFNISDSDFFEILGFIRNVYATCERTPRSYESLDEESLRDLALASLNTVYQGSAVGEAFRNKGKTDICIEEKNRAAFVAECKIWKGAKNLLDAIGQLLSYLTWRDSKTAIILFSRNVNFSNVLTAVGKTLREDPRCQSACNTDWPNEFDCRFVVDGKPGDMTRVRVMVFDLHVDD